MAVYLRSLLLQLLKIGSKPAVLVGMRSAMSKSPEAGREAQLLCFTPVSLKARPDALESKFDMPVTGKWRKPSS